MAVVHKGSGFFFRAFLSVQLSLWSGSAGFLASVGRPPGDDDMRMMVWMRDDDSSYYVMVLMMTSM